MKIAFFSTQPYDITFFESANQAFGHELVFFTQALEPATAGLAAGAQAVCLFVNDQASEASIAALSKLGVSTIALRCAGFNNIDVEAAKKAGIKVCRVGAYSPEAVAEHAVALLLTLTRKTHKAYNRVREQNFALSGLLGFNLHGKKVGVIGTGNIGQAFCKIMLGVGCEVTAFDLRPAAIIRDLDLKRPIYKKTAAYGHFGREDKEFTWEKTDRAEDLKSAIS